MLRWAGYVFQMNDNGRVNQVEILRWIKGIMEQLRTPDSKNWRTIVQHRNKWRRLLGKIGVHFEK